MAEAADDTSTKNFRRNGGNGQLRDRQPGMAEDSAGSTSSRKNLTSWPSLECTRQQRFLAMRWQLEPHLRRKQSTSGRQEVHRRQGIYFSQHEKSQCDLKAIIADVGQGGHGHVDPLVNVKAASTGEFKARKSAKAA